MRHLGAFLLGGATVLFFVAVDKALGITTKLVSVTGVTPK